MNLEQSSPSLSGKSGELIRAGRGQECDLSYLWTDMFSRGFWTPSAQTSHPRSAIRTHLSKTDDCRFDCMESQSFMPKLLLHDQHTQLDTLGARPFPCSL